MVLPVFVIPQVLFSIMQSSIACSSAERERYCQGVLKLAFAEHRLYAIRSEDNGNRVRPRVCAHVCAPVCAPVSVCEHAHGVWFVAFMCGGGRDGGTGMYQRRKAKEARSEVLQRAVAGRGGSNEGGGGCQLLQH